MPKASVDLSTVKKNLKTAPPDGFVVLRRLSFGQKLERQEMATRQVIRGEEGNRAQRRGNQAPNNMEVDIKMLQRVVTEYEFKHCVVDHNLTIDDTQKFNFEDPTTIDRLDPRIGDEISQYIGQMNNFDEEDEDVEGGNFQDASNVPSPEAKTQTISK